tara:strand:+ start:64 stop:735 length:672 start_codon:yes stop_codon:yes gene_type:complete
MKDGKVIAIIPVRKGSKRVPFKNLKPFCNTTLLEIKIKQLKKISLIDDIVVNSDWDEALKLAENLNVSIHKRNPHFASSNINGSIFYKHIAECTCKEYKYILYAPPTSPLITTKTIEKVINKFFNNNILYDSIVTTSLIKSFLWKDNKPLNYELSKTPKTQDLPDIHDLNHAICINTRYNLINKCSLVGENPILYSISNLESIDIDYPIDFEIAEYLYSKYRL